MANEQYASAPAQALDGVADDTFANAGLNKTERDVFSLTSQGLTQQEIAQELKISRPSVSQALASMTSKFEALPSSVRRALLRTPR